jgi:CRP-like cAMP-binding protein
MDKQTKLELIEKIPFFTNAHSEDKDLLADLAYFKAFEAGDFIIEQGSITLTLFFLINGKVSVHIDDKFVINFRGGGQPFGEMSFVNNDLASATIKAESKATMMCFDVDKINSLNDPLHYRMRMNIYHACAEILAKKLNATNAIAKSYMEKLGTSDLIEG